MVGRKKYCQYSGRSDRSFLTTDRGCATENRRFGGGGKPPRLSENDWEITDPENRMEDMHDRRVGRAENSPHFDGALRKADQLALFLAAILDRRACIHLMPGAL